MSPKLKEELIKILNLNLGIFAWRHVDMVGIEPIVMCHRLNIDLARIGVKQKHRLVSVERATTLKEEVGKLLDVGLIKETFYVEWLANPILVKKPK